MKLSLLLLVILTLLGLVEMVRHRANRSRIPIRIHVNGSRGKSSVTRLIAAGLRENGVRTVAKTTGSAARVILPDGGELPVHRRGGPNILEQVRIFRRAADEGAQAIVLECMAVRPDLQWTSEHRIVKSTIGVITNVRPDHLEEMGPTMSNVAESLASTVPDRAVLITAEQQFSSVLEAAAQSRRSTFLRVNSNGSDHHDLDKFSYVEFDENVSLALAVCEAAGVDRQRALEGMRKVQPDRGAILPCQFTDGGKQVFFVSLFAANDPESTASAWERIGLSETTGELVALVNIRADRMRRSKDLAPLFERRIRASRYVLVGERTRLFAEMLGRKRVPPGKIVDLGGSNVDQIWDHLMSMDGERITIVGIGNIGGVGNELIDFIESRRNTA